MNQARVLKCADKKDVARLPRPCTADDSEFWECPS